MMFFHKCYVGMIAFYNMCKCLYKVSARIAAIRVEIVTNDEVEHLERIMEDRVKNLKMKRDEPQEDDDDDEDPPGGFIH